MKKKILILQIILTIFVLATIRDNLYKVLFLLPLWWITFGGLNRKETISFIFINLLFIGNDIGAIRNNFFSFNHPDLLQLPYFEFFMWGYYLLHARRILNLNSPKTIELKAVLLAISFSALFSVVSDKELLLFLTSFILLITFIVYHKKEDFFYCLYLMAIGEVIEYVGLKYDLWTYPEKGFEVAIYQIVVMWGATGLYFRRLLGPWLSKTDRIHSTFYRSHEVIHPLVAKEFQLASEKIEKGESNEAFKIFETIEMYCRKNLISLNYEFYTKYSQAALAEGHLRKAIELSREILPLTTNSAEKAFVYLQLCRLYRMMILMKNARLELKRAFEELELDFPTNSIFQTISVLIEYAMTLVRNISPEIEKKLQVRNTLQLKVALYEEAGLSSYYFREFMPLIQCGLKPKSIAMRLGPSIQLLNWYGGFGCVLAVLKMHGQANTLIDKALQIGKNLDGVYGKSKAKLWHALALDYKGDPQGTAEELNSLLVSESGLSAFDLRLASATLACNLLIRGQMQKSKQAIDLILSEKQNSNLSLFSENRTFVEWYKIPALSFLGETQELESIIKNSQAIFSSVDEEKWQISQFLGGLLMYHYVQGKNANQDEIRDCIKRFESLDLSPRFTFLEASYFWVAKSHLMLELAFNQQISIAEAAKAVSELGQAPKHPSIRAHWFVAQAKLLLLNNQINKSEIFLEKAVSLGKRFENYWVEYEVLNYYSKRTQTAQPENKDQEEIHKFCELHGWKGLLR